MPLPLLVESQCMTFERANRDLLIFEPSQNLIPFAFVLLTASLPAKSTRLSIDVLNFSTPFSTLLISMLIQNTVWDQLLCSFWFVSAITL